MALYGSCQTSDFHKQYCIKRRSDIAIIRKKDIFPAIFFFIVWIENLNSWLFQLKLKSNSNIFTKKYCLIKILQFCFIFLSQYCLWKSLVWRVLKGGGTTKYHKDFLAVFNVFGRKNFCLAANLCLKSYFLLVHWIVKSKFGLHSMINKMKCLMGWWVKRAIKLSRIIWIAPHNNSVRLWRTGGPRYMR